MDNRLRQDIEDLIESRTGEAARIVEGSHSGGGCINDAQRIILADGREFFIKSNSRPLPGMFRREVEALEKMSEVGAIRVPRPLGSGGEQPGGIPFIVMESIPTGSPRSGFHESFGRQFAQFHLKSKFDRFGFDNDNYIGSTPQPNSWEDDWVAFWMKYRSIASVTSNSAMTPSRRGGTAWMLPGVRPSISLASLPTGRTFLPPRESVWTATTEGSHETIPRPFT